VPCRGREVGNYASRFASGLGDVGEVAATPRLQHQPALDGVRGLAVAAVLVFHGGHLTGGYLGVDAFFVLSGFLITSLLLAEARGTGRVSLRHFWVRRARRLLPAVFCVLAAVCLFAAFVAKPEELATIRGDALATLLYVANWRQIITSADYFALFRSPSPLQHTWSLAIEEQFYVVWPLVFLFFVRGRDALGSAKQVLVGAVALAFASFLAMQYFYDAGDAARVYYGTDTRVGSILVGAAMAALLALRGPVKSASGRRVLEGVAIAGIVVIGYAWMHLDGDSPVLYRGGMLALAVLTAVVIAAGVHPQRGPVSRALSWKPICALGLVSYGVYLWHWPIYVYLNSERLHLSGWPLLLVQIAITLAVAYASYRFIERPIRHGAGSKQLMLRLTPVATGGLVVLIILSTTGASTGPAVAAGDGRRVLIVGDSVAHSLAPGFTQAGYDVEEGWAPACRLLRGHISSAKYDKNCPWRPAWRQAIREEKPEVVVAVIGTWDLFDLTVPGVDKPLVPGTPEWDALYTAALEDAIAVLGKEGARIVFPTMPCMTVVKGTPDFNEASGVNVERVRAANKVLLQVAARHPENVVAPDLFGYLCPKGEFEMGTDGVRPVRADGVHYTPEGAELVARWLGPFVRGDDAVQVLVAGDSQAVSLHNASQRPTYHDLGLSYAYTTLLGCGVATGDRRYDGEWNAPLEGCADWPAEYQDLVKRVDPEVAVLLIGVWELFDQRVDGVELTFGTPQHDAYLRRQLEQARSILTARGARLALLSVPCYDATVEHAGTIGTLNDATRVAHLNEVFAEFAQAHPDDVTLVDLHGLLCPDGRPHELVEGQTMRADGVHFTGDGAIAVWEWLAPQLDALAKQ
jgi:peptidoglycan/LPS O-acetylase OafA/YrhL